MLAEGIVPCELDQKFLHILKKTGIDRCKKIFISTVYNDDCDEVQLDQGETRSVKFGREFIKGNFLSLIVLYFTASTLPRGACVGVVVKALRYKPAGRGLDSR